MPKKKDETIKTLKLEALKTALSVARNELGNHHMLYGKIYNRGYELKKQIADLKKEIKELKNQI